MQGGVTLLKCFHAWLSKENQNVAQSSAKAEHVQRNISHYYDKNLSIVTAGQGTLNSTITSSMMQLKKETLNMNFVDRRIKLQTFLLKHYNQTHLRSEEEQQHIYGGYLRSKYLSFSKKKISGSGSVA